ncbi:hypothetical protein AVEN_8074-1 [Araneus ventricosus]|uniref:Uncharacterized protein n=1 Tax=Araneus ventricosus TaxID=182803 RepID=A0A4Y2NCF5_ARAVE|nr:hypothetical protein AVEN_8074-1 [Araneus ventricosus]
MQIHLVPAKGRMFLTPHASFQGGSASDGTLTTEPNKGKQPPALDIPSLGTYLGASRNLYARSHLRECPPTLMPSLREWPFSLIPSIITKWLGYQRN